jgi:Bardet-Biedl syndrome 7 protein
MNLQVAIGDRGGVLQVFSSKKGEITHAFKTLPGQEITRLELGGALGEIIR